MKYAFIYINLILVMVLCLSGCARKAPFSVASTSSPQVISENGSLDYIPCNFYEESAFNNHIASAKPFSSNFKTIQGGIVPHHLLAGTFIASFFKTLAKENPDILIVIGPNHKALGKTAIITTCSSFSTPFGMLETDKSALEQLLKSSICEENQTVFEQDHTISALVPYIKYYMPQVKILPFELKNSLDLASCQDFSNTLTTLVKGRKAVMVASVDFSHYLPVTQADLNDEVTLAAVMKRNVAVLSKLDNGYFDSPTSLITLLYHEQGNPEVVWHSNSARLCGNLSLEQTTSYFCMLFGE